MAEQLARSSDPVCILCAGNGGSFGADDWLAAGALVAGLREAGAAVQADDAARAAEAWFLQGRADLASALAASMGADLTINSRSEDAAKIVQEKTGGAHAAVVTAVAKAAFNSAVDAVRAGGRVVAVGLPPEAMSLDIPRLVLDGIQVVGSLVGTRQDLQEAFQFAAEGKVVPKVTMRPIEDINAIFKEMEQGQIRGRMVIDLRS